MNKQALVAPGIARALVYASLLGLAACGGGGGTEPASVADPVSTPPPAQAPAVTGVAAKGLLVGATVELYALDAFGFTDDSTPLATTETDSNGQFTLQQRPSPGPLLVITRGGSYIDESDPEPDPALKRQITLGNDEGFEAVLPAAQNSLAVTPFSQMVLERAREISAESGRFNDAFVATRARAQSVFGFDPVSVLPANPIAPGTTASAASRSYAMALGGFANQVNSTAIVLGLQPNFPVVSALINDVVDGRFDGQRFGQVIEVDTPNGSQAIPTFDFNDQIERFRNNNFAQYQTTTLVAVDEAALEDDIVLPLPPNEAPVATADTASGDEDGGPINIDVLANDSDSDGPEPLSIVAIGTVASTSGSLSIAADGLSLTFAPAPNFNGTVSTSYSISDGTDTATAALTINIIAVNDPPVALGDAYQTAEDTPLSIDAANGVLSNDTDVDGDSLTAIQGQLTSPGGSLTLASDGSFSFSPAADFAGDAVFNYSAFDGEDPSATVNITIGVIGENDNPVAVDDSFLNIQEDTPENLLDVLTNDSDVESGQAGLVIAAVNGYLGDGTIEFAENGTVLLYTPAENFNGTETFTYTVSDGDGGQDTASVTVQVQPVNDAPTANDDLYDGEFATLEGGTLSVAAPGVLANDSDIDGDTLTVDTTPVSGPSNGSLTLNADGSFDYAHDGSETTQDSFVYRILDGNQGDSQATVTLVIDPVNDAPITIINDGLTVDEGGSGSIVGFNAGNLLTEDNDHASNELTYTLLSVPSDGTLTLLGTVLEVNDTFTQEDLDEAGIEYQHDSSENGFDFFEFEVRDADGALAIAFFGPPRGQGKTTNPQRAMEISGPSSSQFFNISINPINDDPIAIDDSFGGSKAQQQATVDPARDLQPAWDPRPGSDLVVFRTNRQPPSNGSIDNLGQVGVDGSVPEAVLLSGANSGFGISAGEPSWVGTTGRVIVNDTVGFHSYLEFDTATSGQREVLTIPGGAGGGWMHVSRDGSTAIWRYSAQGGGGLTQVRVAPFASLTGQAANAVGTVVFETTPPGQTQVLTEAAVLTNDGSAFVQSESSGDGSDLFLRSSADGSLIRQLTFSGLESGDLNRVPDVSPDGSKVAFANIIFEGTAFNVFTIDLDGSNLTQLTDDSAATEYDPTWSPDGTRLAIRRFDTQANGGHDGSVADNNNIWVISASPAGGSSVTINEGDLTTVPAPGLLENDSDAEFDPLSVTTTPVVGPTNGSLTLRADGSFDYNHAGGENTSDSFVYEVTDGNGGSDTATVNLTITPVNDQPTALDDGFSVDEGATFSDPAFSLLDNDSDPEGDNLTVDPTPVSGPLRGSLTLNTDGTLSYTHDGSENPTDTFGYRIEDGNGGSSTATVTITVNAVNDAPQIDGDQVFDVDEGTANGTIFGTVAATDPDGPNLSYSITTFIDGQPFSIDGASGELIVNNQSVIDFESTPTYTVNIQVSDGLATNNADITIDVNDVNEPPTANGGNVGTTDEDTVDNGTVGVNDTDADDRPPEFFDELTIVSVGFVDPETSDLIEQTVGQAFTLPSGAILTVNADRSYSYDPNLSFEELNVTDAPVSDEFVYTISDGEFEDTATAFQTVTGVDDAPDDPTIVLIEVDPGQTVSITDADLSATDIDSADGDIVFTVTAGPDNGDLLLGGTALPKDGTGTFTQEDLANELVAYQNTSQPAGNQDSFTFQLGSVADEVNTPNDNGPFTFTIDIPPRIPLAESNSTLTGEFGNALLGRIAKNVGDINGDGFDDIAVSQTALVGLPPEQDVQHQVVVVYGAGGPVDWVPSDLDGSNGFIVFSTLFSTSERFGEAIIGVDVDRDGFSDLIVGDPGADLASIDTDDGRVYVLFGDSSLPASNNLTDDGTQTNARFEVLENNDFNQIGAQIGAALAAGDINGDAFPDLLVGAPGAQDLFFGTFPGAALVLFGDENTGIPNPEGPINAIDPDLAIFGDNDAEQFGAAVAAGDVTGDAIADVIVGAPEASRQGVAGSGTVYAIAGRDRSAFEAAIPSEGEGPAASDLLVSAADGFEYQGSNDQNANLGSSVAFADDYNGDGFGDLVVGEPGALFNPGDATSRKGLAHVLFGSSTNPDPATDPNGYFRGELDGSNGLFLFPPDNSGTDDTTPTDPGPAFGFSVGGGGDVNGDGLRDILVGYPPYVTSGAGLTPQAGQAYLLFGQTTSPVSRDVGTLAGINGLIIVAEDVDGTSERAGEQVTSMGDFNGDGFDDLLVSAPLTGANNEGRVHVVDGRNFLELLMTIGDAGDNALPSGNTFIVGGDGDDTLGSLSANSVLRGGRGNDTLDYSTDLLADGGSNDETDSDFDSLLIGPEEGDPVRINNGAVPRAQRARNIESVVLASSTNLALDALEVQSLTDGRNTLLVEGDASNAVATEDAWARSTVVTINVGGTDQDYQRYTSGGATLLVGVDIDQSGIIVTANAQLLSKTDGNPGLQNDGASVRPMISGNGQFVVFESISSVTDDNAITPNGTVKNIYRKSLINDQLEIVTTDGTAAGNGDSDAACVSHSGNLVAFATLATNLPTTRIDNGNSVTVIGRQFVLANLAAQPNPTFEIISGSPGEGFFQFNDVGDDCIFSPDEQYVYFTGEAGGGFDSPTPGDNTHVWRYEIGTGNGLDNTAVSYDAQTDFSYCVSDGETNFGCSGIGVSADGSVVAFAANADFPGDTNPEDLQGLPPQFGYDIVIRDLNQGGFSIAANGAPGTTSARPSLSGSGQLLVFESDSDFSGVSTGRTDIYLLDRFSGVFSTVNTDPSGAANGDPGFIGVFNPDGAGDPRFSTDGRFVTFTSAQDGLDGANHNPTGTQTVFVKQLPGTLPTVNGGLAGPIFRAQRNNNGNFYPNASPSETAGAFASISFDGSALAFSADSDGIVLDDTNGVADTFGFKNPLFTPELLADLDGDTLSDAVELAQLGTNPASTDSDRDRLSDDFEVGFAGAADTYDIGQDTDPNNPDTDGDLLGDGLEFELTSNLASSAVGSAPNTIIFVSDDADGTGDGSGYGLNALTFAQAAVRTDNGAPGDPAIFVIEDGFYSNIPNLVFDGRNDIAVVGSMAPGRLYPFERFPETNLRVDTQSGERMVTIDNSSRITVRNVDISFSRPAAGLPGGGLAVLGTTTASSEILLQSMHLQSNDTVDIGGGGLAVLDGSDVIVENSLISNNDVTTALGVNLHGGGVLVAGAGTTVQIARTTLFGNSLDETSGDGGITFGGGIAVMNGADLDLVKSFVESHGNQFAAADVGGGIYVTGSDITVEDSTVSSNRLSGAPSGLISGYGGGIYLDAIGTADIINSKIQFNQAISELDSTAFGGGIALNAGGQLNVSGSLIASNRASDPGTSGSANGGGIYSGASGNNVSIANTIIADNIAESGGIGSRGGGFYTNSSGSLEIIDSQFRSNLAASAGGGIWISDGNNAGTSLHIVNNLFVGNRAGNGAGIWSEQLSAAGSTTLLQNNTVAFNQATTATQGGGVLVSSGGGTSQLLLLDNIVTSNDDDTVGTANLGDDYVGPTTDNPPTESLEFNLVGDQLVGADAFAVATDPQWVDGFYLTQAGNALVGLNAGPAGGGDTTRTAGNLGHVSLDPNVLTANATTSVSGDQDGGADQLSDNLDIGFHALEASDGSLDRFRAVDPQAGETLFCNFDSTIGASVAPIRIRPQIGTLESKQARLISARALTAGAVLRSRTGLDPLGSGDSVLAIDQGDGAYLVYYDGDASSAGSGANVSIEFFDGADPGETSIGTATYVTDPGFTCGS